MIKDDSEHGTVWRTLKNIFARQAANKASPVVNGHAPGQPAASALSTELPPPQPQPEPPPADEVISRFEPFLAHCPRNLKVITTLAEAYARKMMFDQSLSLYRRALEIAGGKNAGIEAALAETILKKLDMELSQLDPQAPDYATQRECIQNQRLEFQWHQMEGSR
jgi:hypothetical protein